MRKSVAGLENQALGMQLEDTRGSWVQIPLQEIFFFNFLQQSIISY